MKTFLLSLSLLVLATTSSLAQANSNITLPAAAQSGGLSLMEAFAQRASVKEFASTDLSLQDLSDLLWAANGINRPGEKKRTAPSALNAQDIDVYVVLTKGAYLYNAEENVLELIAAGDHRDLVAGRQKEAAVAPVLCVLVADVSRFPFGSPEQRQQWAAMDAGIVSQNIALFCAGKGMLTRPRATMEKQKLRELLQLKESQYLLLNNPVSYQQ